MSEHRHIIGLLLGTEEDWPTAFESIVRRLGTVHDGTGAAHPYDVERITVEPFDLCAKPRYDLVIDRLAYWYYHPREWLKKAALMDDVYLLNSPFTFQRWRSTRRTARCCGWGCRCRTRCWCRTRTRPRTPSTRTRRDVQPAVRPGRHRRAIGYPLFMKPYDGGAWVGVPNPQPEELQRPMTPPASG